MIREFIQTAGLETVDWILNAQNNLHQTTGQNWRHATKEVNIHDKNHFPFTYNSYPNCSEQEETKMIYANMKDYDKLIPLTT